MAVTANNVVIVSRYKMVGRPFEATTEPPTVRRRCHITVRHPGLRVAIVEGWQILQCLTHGDGRCARRNWRGGFNTGIVRKPGNFLLSHIVAYAVPSGLRGLTAVFGMGTGGSSSLRSPRNCLRDRQHALGGL
jgi:hypothetical protein